MIYKYNGFSVTADGETETYIVINRRVYFADGRNSKDIWGEDLTLNMQKAYEQEGSVDRLVAKINCCAWAEAQKVTDKEVERLVKKRDRERKKAEQQLNKLVYRRKKGVNRHTAYWSAM